MTKLMSLLSCICVVLVFVEFQSLVDGPGMSCVGGIICPQASQTCCDNPKKHIKSFKQKKQFYMFRKTIQNTFLNQNRIHRILLAIAKSYQKIFVWQSTNKSRVIKIQFFAKTLRTA